MFNEPRLDFVNRDSPGEMVRQAGPPKKIYQKRFEGIPCTSHSFYMSGVLVAHTLLEVRNLVFIPLLARGDGS